MTKGNYEQVKTLIKDAVRLICHNAIPEATINIEGLLGVTVNKDDVFLINLKEEIVDEKGQDKFKLTEKKKGSSKRKSPPIQFTQKRKICKEDKVEALDLSLKQPPSKTQVLLNVPVFPERQETPVEFKNEITTDNNYEKENGEKCVDYDFSCLVPGCYDSEVIYGSSLLNHENSQNIVKSTDDITEEMLIGNPVGDGLKDRRRECPICHKILSEPAKMRRHVATVHGKVRHQCPLCSGTYTRRDNMLTHMRIIHPEAVHLYTKSDDIRRNKLENTTTEVKT